MVGKPRLTRARRRWQTGYQGSRPTRGNLPRLPAPQTTVAALNVVFLRLGLVGTLSVRSCFTKRSSVVADDEPACMFNLSGCL